MDHQHGQSHRQEREHKKTEHAQPTRGKYFASKHLTWTAIVGAILMGGRDPGLDLPLAGLAWARLFTKIERRPIRNG
jgi:hypothetical protein